MGAILRGKGTERKGKERNEATWLRVLWYFYDAPAAATAGWLFLRIIPELAGIGDGPPDKACLGPGEVVGVTTNS